MKTSETLEEFYKTKLNWLPDNLQKDVGHFNVFRLEDCMGIHGQPVQYRRREFYKISLLKGRYLYHYADKTIETNGNTLLFFNPHVPYTVEKLSDDGEGYFCIFKETFFTTHMRTGLHDLPMYTPGNIPGYELDDAQMTDVQGIFERMLTEIQSDYLFKYDLLRNYTMELIHYALKSRPTEKLYQHVDANARITAVFTELLERQFPIESTSQRFTLRSARDFADQLAVHVNHLNRAIRNTTGKTTTEHIFERLVGEAKALLRHTNWNISEISYCLGFDEPAHFNHFFKKQTNSTPSAFRI
jgi:AraC family transcriptional activator of pobA